MKCEICSSEMSEPVQELFALPSVASDCRPWSKGRSVQICSGCGVMKRVTNDDFDHSVYKDYTSYPEPTGRTKSILEFVAGKISLCPMHMILDIGCGNGAGIKVIRDVFPESLIYGYEPTIHKERPIGKYDLITLFHVFEHVEDLHEMLAYIKSSLTDNGHVLIQVPYAAMWPFDLVIADHVWHFTMDALIRILDQCGFKIDYIGSAAIPKELTVLASIGKCINSTCIEESGKSPINWLLNFKKKLDDNEAYVAVYGTSVSAMWTGDILGNKVICYLDDDKSRLGIFNRNVVIVPELNHLPVIAPFPDWQLPDIKAKNPDMAFL